MYICIYTYIGMYIYVCIYISIYIFGVYVYIYIYIYIETKTRRKTIFWNPFGAVTVCLRWIIVGYVFLVAGRVPPPGETEMGRGLRTIYIYIYIYIHIHTHTYTYIHIHISSGPILLLIRSRVVIISTMKQNLHIQKFISRDLLGQIAPYFASHSRIRILQCDTVWYQ